MQDRSSAEIIRDQRPLTVPPDLSVAQACAAMHKRRLGAVMVVVDLDRLVGIFTGRDAVRCLAEGCDAIHTRLEQVMTRNPTTLASEQTAIDALRLFNDGGFRHLPICHKGRVIGIVSRHDFRAMEHARLDEETRFFEILR
ncbi:CBS domain-containing protein [Roseomonas xinghualingensis]|uniref:CBS domain-containing protein n=1 Tax=Roseomonas xinghualingensis TaxID=2986475 RepID=UPI0021F1D7BE|nr:CBS domain-containing protein [Roseomonas sp. SXEYE001]MCV4209622.1 CBS domain-containing protein [Roseomonas sp. SXEYE001]